MVNSGKIKGKQVIPASSENLQKHSLSREHLSPGG